MATITAVNLETALGVSGAATPYFGAGDLPLFEAGQTVGYLADLPTSGSGGQASISFKTYTVEAVVLKWALDGSSDTQILDQLEAAATPASQDGGATTRAVLGFNHDMSTGTLAATTANPTDSCAWFYDIKEAGTGKYTRGVHQMQLNSVANMETYIAAEIAGWFN
jgi:hypothetical protein